MLKFFVFCDSQFIMPKDKKEFPRTPRGRFSGRVAVTPINRHSTRDRGRFAPNSPPHDVVVDPTNDADNESPSAPAHINDEQPNIEQAAPAAVIDIAPAAVNDGSMSPLIYSGASSESSAPSMRMVRFAEDIEQIPPANINDGSMSPLTYGRASSSKKDAETEMRRVTRARYQRPNQRRNIRAEKSVPDDIDDRGKPIIFFMI